MAPRGLRWPLNYSRQASAFQSRGFRGDLNSRDTIYDAERRHPLRWEYAELLKKFQYGVLLLLPNQEETFAYNHVAVSLTRNGNPFLSVRTAHINVFWFLCELEGICDRTDNYILVSNQTEFRFIR